MDWRELRAILAGQVRIPIQFLTWMISNKMNSAAFSSMSEKDGVLLVVLQFEEELVGNENLQHVRLKIGILCGFLWEFPLEVAPDIFFLDFKAEPFHLERHGVNFSLKLGVDVLPNARI